MFESPKLAPEVNDNHYDYIKFKFELCNLKSNLKTLPPTLDWYEKLQRIIQLTLQNGWKLNTKLKN